MSDIDDIVKAAEAQAAAHRKTQRQQIAAQRNKWWATKKLPQVKRIIDAKLAKLLNSSEFRQAVRQEVKKMDRT